MIRRVLDTPGFYYSNSYDLTHSMQRRHTSQQTKSNFSQLSLYERADERFVWNGHILRDLVVQPEMRRFTVPVIHGYVSVVGSAINGKGFSFVVISRRSTYRAGIKLMWGRGGKERVRGRGIGFGRGREGGIRFGRGERRGYWIWERGKKGVLDLGGGKGEGYWKGRVERKFEENEGVDLG